MTGAAVATVCHMILTRDATSLLIVAAVLLAGCQTADDQLIDLPPTDRGTAVATATPTMAETDCMRPDVTSADMPDLHPSVDSYEAGVVRISDDAAGCNQFEIPVRIADDGDKRGHGLMEVEFLPDGVGMWFDGYTEDRTGGFYMKNTLVPLQIAYVAADGRIVDLVEMVPCEADPCDTYPPDAPYRTTLEVPSGWFDSVGIDVGDHIELVDRENAG